VVLTSWGTFYLYAASYLFHRISYIPGSPRLFLKSYFEHFKNLYRFKKGGVFQTPPLYVQHPGMSIGFWSPVPPGLRQVIQALIAEHK
jgi:hypothetical protein